MPKGPFVDTPLRTWARRAWRFPMDLVYKHYQRTTNFHVSKKLSSYAFCISGFPSISTMSIEMAIRCKCGQTNDLSKRRTVGWSSRRMVIVFYCTWHNYCDPALDPPTGPPKAPQISRPGGKAPWTPLARRARTAREYKVLMRGT